jgi:hypothetical protein
VESARLTWAIISASIVSRSIPSPISPGAIVASVIPRRIPTAVVSIIAVVPGVVPIIPRVIPGIIAGVVPRRRPTSVSVAFPIGIGSRIALKAAQAFGVLVVVCILDIAAVRINATHSREVYDVVACRIDGYYARPSTTIVFVHTAIAA